MQENLFNDIQPNDLRQPPLQQCSVVGSESGYWADIAWTSWFHPFKKTNPIFLTGDCMENAVNNFYKNNSGGEIMHIYDVS